jgi:hypothetical protein
MVDALAIVEALKVPLPMCAPATPGILSLSCLRVPRTTLIFQDTPFAWWLLEFDIFELAQPP